ncbi:DUF1572 family protein [Paenibacillus sp. YPG26]|uniref:DUF1572 family protein n=1 Tax=Paenibacillus sp. YPG26 TaxID=2878915 RepID=UPI00203CB47B|nr:DUF1572 family protein [Paenibacillus sp. YPG26]USB34040.1 DUF1572 domain-containing protein [Paenibacillus sp. YPG26]
MDSGQIYLDSIRSQFRYYKELGEQAIEQLEPEQLFTAYNDDTNSIATIVKHLSGNMLSRWTHFLTEDGEKPWRDRDEEFVHDIIVDKEELMRKWEAGWACLFGALDDLRPDQLLGTIYIRNEGQTVMEAVNRQLAHYPYHVGQIIYAAKLLKHGSWLSLTIPRNSSGSDHAEQFSNDTVVRNFTVEELKKHE